MSKETFLLIAISYYLITIIIIVIVLAILNKITIQLNHNGMMTVVATKAPPRLL